jgi:hypothetical protein
MERHNEKARQISLAGFWINRNARWSSLKIRVRERMFSDHNCNTASRDGIQAVSGTKICYRVILTGNC